jgi:S1-C subfamily serine protease
MTSVAIQICAATAISLTALLPATGAAKPPDQVFEQVSPSVFVVNVYRYGLLRDTGSGVVIADGMLITNCHVTKEGLSYTVTLA